MHRLLLMSCGKRKRLDTASLPALDRYDGPSFRVLRRYLATHPASPPDIYILSARYGLISSNYPIPNYDQRMTPQRAAELQPAVNTALALVVNRQEYEQLHVSIGRDYTQAFEGSVALAPRASVTFAHGTQGQRLSQLRDWLYGPEDMRIVPKSLQTHRMRQRRGIPQVRGVSIALTAAQALASARQGLATDSHGCDHFHAWYVLIDGARVAPKWLVSRISGLPVGAFTTQDAMRVLECMGIAVHRATSL